MNSIEIDDHTSSEIVFRLLSPLLFKRARVKKRSTNWNWIHWRIVKHNEIETYALGFAFIVCASYCTARPQVKKHVEFYFDVNGERRRRGLAVNQTAKIILVTQVDSDTQICVSESSLFSQKQTKKENMNEFAKR